MEMSKGGGGGSYTPPGPTESELTNAKISAEKWDDFITRYTPVEAGLRDSTKQLDSTAAYTKAMSKATNNASMQMGDASLAAAKQMASGGSPLAMLSAYTGANDMSANGIAQQYAGQRANYLNRAKGLTEMGAGISGQGMGAFKSVAEYDADEANRNYATNVARDIANTNAMTANIGALGSLGTQYMAYNSLAPRNPVSTPWNDLSSGVSNGYTSPELTRYADMQNFGSFWR
jgi:hypothetical protein